MRGGAFRLSGTASDGGQSGHPQASGMWLGLDGGGGAGGAGLSRYRNLAVQVRTALPHLRQRMDGLSDSLSSGKGIERKIFRGGEEGEVAQGIIWRDHEEGPGKRAKADISRDRCGMSPESLKEEQ